MVVYASGRAGEGQLDFWLQRTSGGQPSPYQRYAQTIGSPTSRPTAVSLRFVRTAMVAASTSCRHSAATRVSSPKEGGVRDSLPTAAVSRSGRDHGSRALGARGPGRSVFIVPANGGQPTRIADGFWTARDPVWSPDGQSLLFFGRKTADDSPSGRFDWWWAPLDGREPVPTGAYRIMAEQGLSDPIDSDAVWRASGARAGDLDQVRGDLLGDPRGKRQHLATLRLSEHGSGRQNVSRAPDSRRGIRSAGIRR